MSMIKRYRHRRDAARNARAFEDALRVARSAAVRDEVRAIATRFYS